MNDDQIFREATLRICGHLEIEVALFECLRYLMTEVPMDRVQLGLWEPDVRSIRLIAYATSEGGHASEALIPMDLEATRSLERMRAEFEASEWPDADIINDPAADPAMAALDSHIGPGPRSMMHLRLETVGRPLCSLLVVGKGAALYTHSHARVLNLLKGPVSTAMSNALKHREVNELQRLLADDNRFLQKELLHLTGEQIVGADFGLKGVMDMVRQVAPSDSPVLLTGETGTGKDVMANAIHYASDRKSGPFIAVNCGAIPDNLLDSELFGHEKGAFTGAISRKRGRFERSNHGTIFLDEIGELPPHAQVRLLRVLQNREIERVGGVTRIPLDIRVIAATNRNLESLVRSGQFREDLWFRLNVFPIALPPLRERKQDIPALIRHFIGARAKALKMARLPRLAPGALEQLVAYDWPGNVRELQNVIERALILSRGDDLTFDSLFRRSAAQTASAPASIAPQLDHRQMSVRYFTQILDATDGRIQGPNGAAELTGLNPSTLRSKLRKLGIPYGAPRG